MNIKKTFVLTLALFVALVSFADSFNKKGINYETTSQTEVQVVGGNGVNGAVDIPESVSNNGHNYRVTAIRHNAFEGNNHITSVTIPRSVTKIEWSAFNRCQGLTTVIDNSSVEVMDGYIFTDCSNLTVVRLSNALKRIGQRSFANTALTSIALPEGFEGFGDQSFCGCRSLSSVYYSGNNCLAIEGSTFADTPKDFTIYVNPSALNSVSGMAYYGNKVKDKIPYVLTNNYVTFSRDFAIDFSSAPGLTAYVAQRNNNASIKLVAITGAVAAGTGLILKGNVGQTYNLTISSNGKSYEDNLLNPSDGVVVETNKSDLDAIRFKSDGTNAYLPKLLSTDKVRYRPGDMVNFTLSLITFPNGAKVRYLHGNTVVGTADVGGKKSWTWKVPKDDFKGYLAEVYVKEGDKDKVLSTIGIDVSSNWKRFPRYGFLSDFQNSKMNTMNKEVNVLLRHHITGLQFYDWQWQHHIMWEQNNNGTWHDFANREISVNVLRNYISKLHNVGAKCMFYNLCYGATGDLKNGEAFRVDYLDKDKVNGREWGMIWYDNDTLRQGSYNAYKKWPNIYLMNPSNEDWIKYMTNSVNLVYKNLPFDGFHVDQVGKRTDWLYNADNTNRRDDREIYEGFAKFLKAMKAAQPEKYLVMNSVSNYGRRNIVGSGSIEFAYNEMWEGERWYTSFRDAIKGNREESANPKLNTVFAAYMNYRRDNLDMDKVGGQIKPFNTPLVRFTDAVIFALGGAHIELSGDHMLYTEYFPDAGKKRESALENSLVTYYDFLTAYENYLRDGNVEKTVTMKIGGKNVKAWEPELGNIVSYSTQKDNKTMIQLLNFTNANRLTWRLSKLENGEEKDKSKVKEDVMNEPNLYTQEPVTLYDEGNVTRIWVATPDALGGAPQEVKFTQDRDVVKFTLPSLKYWTMIVVEHGAKPGSQAAQARNYVLQGDKFSDKTYGFVPAGEAYLSFPSDAASSLQSVLSLVPVTAGIENVTTDNANNTDDGYYTVSGIKVDKPTKGVYIHKGKKVVIK